jgi:hypothetical protein
VHYFVSSGLDPTACHSAFEQGRATFDQLLVMFRCLSHGQSVSYKLGWMEFVSNMTFQDYLDPDARVA